MPKTTKKISAGADDGTATKVKANKSSATAKLNGPLPGKDALEMLAADHREVSDLFSQFETASGDANKRDLASAICVALKVHARLEEELFYPAVFSALKDKALLEEAMIEHASARDLIAQIEASAPGDAFYDARVKVLSEYVRHHVDEEEGEIFPQVRKSKMDIIALGALMGLRKQELMTGFLVSNPVLALS